MVEMTDDQAANWRAAMRLLTSWFAPGSETEREELSRTQLAAEVRERGVDGLIGTTMALQGMAAVLVKLLAAATQRTPDQVVQFLGHGGEQLIADT